MLFYLSKKRAIIFVAALVFILAHLMPPIFANAAGKAGLFLRPAAGNFLVGSTFDLSIVLDTKGAPVNAVEVELFFPADKIQIANPSIGKSIVQVWAAPPAFSNREGMMYFIGGIPSPGITTSNGVVLTLTFRVVAPGEGEIKFGKKTSVLANDGSGTDILGQKPSAFFSFSVPPPLGPAISSPTHPDQERWYRDTNPVFVWPRSRFASGYSYSIDDNPNGFPDTILEGDITTASFQNLENGIWYFHLRELAGGIWGGVSHYVLKIDNQPPAGFKVNVSPGKRTTSTNPIFRFFTTDALSGFDHFKLKIIPLSKETVSESFFFESTSPYQAPNFSKGRYQVIVRALDKAGNSKDETVTMNIVSPFFSFITPEGINLAIFFLAWSKIISFMLLIILIFIIILFFIWRRNRHHLVQALKKDIRRIYKFFWVLILFAGLSFAVSALAAEQLPKPTIDVAPSAYYPLDEILYIEGKAEPKSNVELFFEKQDRQPVRAEIIANSNGDWFFNEHLELASGEWTVRARSADDSEISDWSNPRIIRSYVSGFILGSLKIKYAPAALILLGLFIVAVLLLAYSFFHMRNIRRIELERKTLEKIKDLEKKLYEEKILE